MRYRTGSLNLSPLEDDPLLWQVMQSRYISHEQLWKCVLLRNRTTPRSTFNWRVGRLVRHGLLNRLSTSSAGLGAVYCVRRPALEYLASRGECVPDFDWILRRPQDAGLGTILHSLGLNDIHLRLKAAGIPFGWRWEPEVRARNELTGAPYAKDYDAIISVYLDDREINVALEYERMAKSGSRYATIRRLIEKNVNMFLYLAPHYNILSFVRQHFENTRKQVYFGLLADFTESAIDMKVVDSQLRSKPFREVLRNGKTADGQA